MLLLHLPLLLPVAMAVGPTAASRRLVAAFKPPPPEAHRLAEFLDGCKRVVSITGAGISTESGIPDYRSPGGSYSRGFKPMVHDQFISSPYHRARYWARSMIGEPIDDGRAPTANERGPFDSIQ